MQWVVLAANQPVYLSYQFGLLTICCALELEETENFCSALVPGLTFTTQCFDTKQTTFFMPPLP